VDLREVGKDALDEIHGVGPLWVTRELSLNPRWIRRFGDYLGFLKICCLFAHETSIAYASAKSLPLGH
jgi:hypothetical protein